MSDAWSDLASLGLSELDDETPDLLPSVPRTLARRIIMRAKCAFKKVGEDVQFLRLPLPISGTVKCVVRGLTPEQLAAGVEQGSQNGLVLADDLAVAGYPVPLKKRDRVVRRGEAFTITHDPEFRRVGGEDVLVSFIFKG